MLKISWYFVCFWQSKVQPAKKGSGLPAVESDFLIHIFAHAIIKGATIKDVKDAAAHSKKVHEYINLKWPELNDNTRVLRLRNILRNYKDKHSLLKKAKLYADKQ